MRRQKKRTRFQRLQRLSNGHCSALTILYGRRFLLVYPDHGPAWMLVGIALVGFARYEEAGQAFAKAIEFCPAEKVQAPFSQMGHMFREAGDYDQAAVWFRMAIDADPGDAAYHIFLGAVRAKQGRFQEAEEEHRAAIECPEGCIDEAYFNLGLVLRARERFGEAAECFRMAIQLDPEYRPARRALRDVERCMKLR